MDGCPLGLGLVVEDEPTEFSCTCTCSTKSPDLSKYIVGNHTAC